MIRNYGWKPDKPDHRDYLFRAKAKRLPKSVDLRKLCSPVRDQGALGSCTGFAWAEAVYMTRRIQQTKQTFVPSPLFIYYQERVIENTVKYDSGAEIRDGIKSIADDGVCAESLWPYVVSKYRNKPSKSAYTAAQLSQAVEYQRIESTDLTQLRGCLSDGFPFVIGFSVYASFETKAVEKTGVVNMPIPGDYLLGGHAVTVVGYDDATQRFRCKNSWGKGWGDKGYFTIPYDYLTNDNLADDFWTIRLMEDE